MRVAFDASELGSRGQTGDRGIKRVTQSLAIALSAHPEVEMMFTGLSFSDSRNLIRLLPQQVHRHAFPCAGSALTDIIAGFGGRFLIATKLRPKRAFLTRLARRTVRRLISPILERSDGFCARVIKHADVLHSPYRPLPDKNWEVPAFITIYDLIPVLYPELVPKSCVESTRAIIASLRPDVWVMSISERVKRDICEVTGFPEERVFAIPLAASQHTFYPADEAEALRVRRQYGLADVPYFLSLSALDARKNLSHLLVCFEQLIKTEGLTGLRLVLVGASFEADEKLASLLEGNPELAKRVVLTGFVPDTDLAGLYSGATAFAFPSLAEGFGLPVLEAMQCGVPVVVSNRTSLPEVVGDAGFLLDPLDEDGWMDAMLNIYRSSQLRSQLRQKSIARARLFSWEKTADMLVSAYRTAASTRSKAD